MKILFICKRYYTNKDLLKDRFGRLYHLPIGLARLGADVSAAVIDYRNSLSEEISAEEVVFQTISATHAKLITLPLNLYRRAQVIQPEIIIASGDSHIGFLGMFIARKLHAHFVFDVYDYYPVFQGNRLPGMKTMFRLATIGADQVLCASTTLVQRLGQLNPHVLLVENGVDRNLFSPSRMANARSGLGLKSNLYLIGYFGSITPARGPLLIEACRLLRRENPNLQLILAGPVTDVDICQPWIIYLGEIPQTDLPPLINACNVVTIPYANDSFNGMTGACKIAEYLACSKPIVATRVSSHEEIFKEAPNSLCEPNPEDMATALWRQLTDPQITSFPEHLAWSNISSTLHKKLSEILT